MTDRQMEGWMNGWMDGWMDGYRLTVMLMYGRLIIVLLLNAASSKSFSGLHTSCHSNEINCRTIKVKKVM